VPLAIGSRQPVNLWVRARQVGHVVIGELGKGISAYPFMTVYPQDRHERFLIEHLRRAGIEVERQTALVDFAQAPDRVRIRLKHASGEEETCEAAYVAGCDGAHSRVREVLGVGFPGGTYSHVFYVADVVASGPVINDELHVALDDADFLGIFPLKGGRTGRLIGTVLAEDEDARESLRWEGVGRHVAERMGIQVERVNWFSTYRVHHRVAGRFQKGRVFLLGDAAHIHSPVGAQGMNTGIGDAVNLAWKLTDVIEGRAEASLLDSYESERIAFARRLVRTTDRAFVLATSPGRLARFVRVHVLPWILPLLFHFRALQRFMFRTVSQTSISYRGSPLSVGKLGRVHGGDRLPWVGLDGSSNPTDNFAAKQAIFLAFASRLGDLGRAAAADIDMSTATCVADAATKTVTITGVTERVNGAAASIANSEFQLNGSYPSCAGSQSCPVLPATLIGKTDFVINTH